MRCPGRSPTRSQPAPARSWSAISSEYSWLYSRQHQDSDPILTDPSRTRPCFPVIPNVQPQLRRPGPDPGPSDFDFPETRTPKSALFPVIPNVKPNFVAPGLTRGPATLIFRKPEPGNPGTGLCQPRSSRPEKRPPERPTPISSPRT